MLQFADRISRRSRLSSPLGQRPLLGRGRNHAGLEKAQGLESLIQRLKLLAANILIAASVLVFDLVWLGLLTAAMGAATMSACDGDACECDAPEDEHQPNRKIRPLDAASTSVASISVAWCYRRRRGRQRHGGCRWQRW